METNWRPAQGSRELPLLARQSFEAGRTYWQGIGVARFWFLHLCAKIWRHTPGGTGDSPVLPDFNHVTRLHVFHRDGRYVRGWHRRQRWHGGAIALSILWALLGCSALPTT